MKNMAIIVRNWILAYEQSLLPAGSAQKVVATRLVDSAMKYRARRAELLGSILWTCISPSQ